MLWSTIVHCTVTAILFTALVFLELDSGQLHKKLAVVEKENSRTISVFEHRFEELEEKKFQRLNARLHRTAKHFHAMLKKLRERFVRLRKQQNQAWAARVVRRDLNKIKGWRWFQAAAQEDIPLRKAINRITSDLLQARQQGLSDSEVGSSKKVLSQLKKDREKLTLHRIPEHFADHMKLAKNVINFLKAAAHPHVLHNGYIYATMDFANPAGDDDGGPPTNGRQQEFLSLPHGWQLAPGAQDSHTVSINFGWSTDCLTFSDGTSWQTNDGSGNGSCGKQTLHSNKRKQYMPAPDSDHTRRILMRYPVPK